MQIYTVETSKEALKFSAAHMATYADGSIERLHGHNYQVTARLSGRLDAAGMVLDVGELKRMVRALCDELDERVLLPTQNTLITMQVDGDCVRLDYREKYYLLPLEDALLLPIPNTTMEHLARYLAQRLADDIAAHESAGRMTRLSVSVSETPGQSACWTLDLAEQG